MSKNNLLPHMKTEQETTHMDTTHPPTPAASTLTEEEPDYSIDYENLKHNPLSEQIAKAIADRNNAKGDLSFFRFHIAYYFCMMAAMMRTTIELPDGESDLISMFTINLAPSGYGKGVSTATLNEQVIDRFSEVIRARTWPAITDARLRKLAQRRSIQNQTEFDHELKNVQDDFRDVGGKVMFSFEKPTEAALKQNRTMLLMAGIGGMNLSTDEIGANLFKSRDAIDNFLTLYDGVLQNNLVKHTKDSKRADDLTGKIPANMVLFGVPSGLLDQDKVQEQFLTMLEYGYARRCFYSYVPEGKRDRVIMTPQQRMKKALSRTSKKALDKISQQFQVLADQSRVGQKLTFSEDAALTLFQFDNDCKLIADAMQENHPYPTTELKLRVYEIEHRCQKVQRLAGAYAFVENASEVGKDHVLSAIRMAQESSEAFERMMKSEESHVKLAKYLGTIKRSVTQPHLIETLPFFKKANKQERDNMITQAVAWGYTNNLLIKRKVSDSVEFIKGEALEPTDLDKIKVSHSLDITECYRSQTIAFDRLHTMCTAENVHWINHELEYGVQGAGYRHNDNCLKGFNIIVIDVDNGLAVETAMRLLEGYKALYYTTKSHTPVAHRFRIVIPTNYELKLNAEDFEELMKNIFEWLPFTSDEATGQRSRKWMSHKGQYVYTDGEPLDVLPFIPKTTRNDSHRMTMDKYTNLDGLSKWFALNSFKGNRNNHMLRYAHVLADLGYDEQLIRENVLALNEQLADSMTVDRIERTIMVTMKKRLATQGTANQAAP